MSDLAAIILAAGKGSRMKSDLAKVLHEAAGAPMIRWVVDACREAGCAPIVLIVGHQRQAVIDLYEGDDDVRFAVQEEQLGTGHAARCAEESLSDFTGDTLVLAGDGPLIRASTLRRLADQHRSSGAACTMATTTVADPTGYGRIVRDAQGRFERIVEQRDLAPGQDAIREVNPSIFCFDAQRLFGALERVKRSGSSGEYYLTDVPELLLRDGQRVELLAGLPADEAESVNTPEQLAAVDRVLRARAAGVKGGGGA